MGIFTNSCSGWWKGLTKRLVKSGGDNKNASLSIGALMDILAAGKMMVSYFNEIDALFVLS